MAGHFRRRYIHNAAGFPFDPANPMIGGFAAGTHNGGECVSSTRCFNRFQLLETGVGGTERIVIHITAASWSSPDSEPCLSPAASCSVLPHQPLAQAPPSARS